MSNTLRDQFIQEIMQGVTVEFLPVRSFTSYGDKGFTAQFGERNPTRGKRYNLDFPPEWYEHTLLPAVLKLVEERAIETDSVKRPE